MIIKKNISLKTFTTIRLGGIGKKILFPENLEDIHNITDILISPKTLILGKGSNIAFNDKGYNGNIISLKYFKKTDISIENKKYINLSANISCARLAKYCYKKKIPGYEFLHGIPGTLGGALIMNAGAFKQEIWDSVHSARFVDSHGALKVWPRERFKTSYRKIYRDKIALFLDLTLMINTKKKFNKDLLGKYSNLRTDTQPVKQWSSGCIFKNPSKDISASYLIDSSDILPRRIGGIYISNKHCNYFINDGTGTCKDLVKLIEHVQNVVKGKYNILLKKEICIF